jgi:hypothetical protein
MGNGVGFGWGGGGRGYVFGGGMLTSTLQTRSAGKTGQRVGVSRKLRPHFPTPLVGAHQVRGLLPSKSGGGKPCSYLAKNKDNQRKYREAVDTALKVHPSPPHPLLTHSSPPPPLFAASLRSPAVWAHGLDAMQNAGRTPEYNQKGLPGVGEGGRCCGQACFLRRWHLVCG